jgi:putative addiction module CopG family antidote
MYLSLSPDWQRFIESKVKAGEYASPEEVIQAGLASLTRQARHEALSPEELKAIYPNLHADIAAGLQDARAGRVSDGEAFFEALERDGA